MTIEQVFADFWPQMLGFGLVVSGIVGSFEQTKKLSRVGEKPGEGTAMLHIHLWLFIISVMITAAGILVFIIG